MIKKGPLRVLSGPIITAILRYLPPMRVSITMTVFYLLSSAKFLLFGDLEYSEYAPNLI